jgi:F-type H+-transporting ATPase subunit b
MKFLVLSLIQILSVTSALANEAEKGTAHVLDAHAQHVLLFQFINVSILIVGLIYFLRKPLREMFAEKKTSFLAAAEKSQELQKRAADEFNKVQAELNKLNSTATDSIERAKKEAAELKKTMITDATATAKKIKEDSENSARLEVERAKKNVRDSMIDEAFKLADAHVQKTITSEDHVRLNKEFVKNIEVVKA